ncbi:MAG TPA: T9SS type A sorting domain-containing protein, partial [Chitinophagales bacterium]|nr:T9SS type A sorting domain-containing protein [Chitinophagales bacterium]
LTKPINQHPMKKLYICLGIILLANFAGAQTPTWGNGVACIMYTHCTTCHHPDGIAPFSLIDYQDAYNQRQNIAYDINNKIMPPFPPDINYQHYQHERYLTAQELQILNAWVSGGAPMGDTTQAPPAPVYTTETAIPNPDFTSRIPDYVVPPATGDIYRCFVVSNPFQQSVYVSGIEVIPGNSSIVHHVLVYQDTSAIPVQLDSSDPGPGYTNFGGIGSNTAKLMGAWVPGSGAYFLPDSMGIKIPVGGRIVLQIHYPLGSSGQLDSTRINVKFNYQSGIRNVAVQPILNHFLSLTDGPLVIPANTVDTFHEQFTMPGAVSILSIAPHAHLICQSMEAFAVLPGGDTLPLIKIDNWNFHWQGSYSFKKLLHLPGGTVLHGIAVYNNTSSNPENPNDPPTQVSLGEATTDEMMLFFFAYTGYQAGDEDRVYDTTTSIATYNNCTYTENVETGLTAVENNLNVTAYPNPTAGQLEVTINGAAECNARLSDITGKILLNTTLRGGYNTLDMGYLAKGIYFMSVTDTNDKLHPSTLKIVKQ